MNLRYFPASPNALKKPGTPETPLGSTGQCRSSARLTNWAASEADLPLRGLNPHGFGLHFLGQRVPAIDQQPHQDEVRAAILDFDPVHFTFAERHEQVVATKYALALSCPP